MLSCLYLFAVVSLAANSPPVPTPAAAESQGKRVVVSGLKAAGVTADVVQVMAGQIRSAIVRAKVHTLVSLEDAEEANKELERQLEEGCDDEDCMEMIGASLGAQLLLSGQIGRVGEAVTFDLKMVDIKTLKATATASRRLKGVVEDLLPHIDQMVAELCGLKELPVNQVEGLALVPIQPVGEAVKKADAMSLDGEAATAADRSRHFKQLMTGKVLIDRLPDMIRTNLDTCFTAGCLTSVARRVNLPYAASMSVTPVGMKYLVTAFIADAKKGQIVARESQTIPDHASLGVGVRTVLGAAVQRVFDPMAPQLHQAMKVSVVAGVDPELRARRMKAFRYGGWAVVASGIGLSGFGLFSTLAAENKLDQLALPSNDNFHNSDAWHRATGESDQGLTLQLAGLGASAAGAAIVGLSYLQ
jgi:hypothetical protein